MAMATRQSSQVSATLRIPPQGSAPPALRAMRVFLARDAIALKVKAIGVVGGGSSLSLIEFLGVFLVAKVWAVKLVGISVADVDADHGCPTCRRHWRGCRLGCPCWLGYVRWLLDGPGRSLAVGANPDCARGAIRLRPRFPNDGGAHDHDGGPRPDLRAGRGGVHRLGGDGRGEGDRDENGKHGNQRTHDQLLPRSRSSVG